jgi:hypothetical protein
MRLYASKQLCITMPSRMERFEFTCTGTPVLGPEMIIILTMRLDAYRHLK